MCVMGSIQNFDLQVLGFSKNNSRLGSNVSQLTNEKAKKAAIELKDTVSKTL